MSKRQNSRREKISSTRREEISSKWMGLPLSTRWLIISIALFLTAFTALAVRSSMRNESDDNVIKIGAILPQTGPGAVFAQYIREGSDLAVEEINAGDTRKVRVLYEDSKNSPREAITVYNKLVSTEHPPVVMVALSSVARAVAPLAKESDTAQVYIAVATPEATDGEYTFRVYPEAKGMAGVMAKFTTDRLRLKNAAILFVNDDFGLVSRAAYENKIKEGGGQLVFSESYELQETDFRAQISKLKNANPAPEVIYLCGYGPSYGAVIRQLREQNVTAQITADMTMGLATTQEQVGAAGDNIFFVDGKFSDDFNRRFHDKYGKNPSSYAGYAYDIVRILSQIAKRKPEFTRKTVSEGLLETKNYPGAMGNISIDKSGDSSVEFVVNRMKNGKAVVAE